VYQAHQHHRCVSHKWLHPNKPYEGQMQPHKASGPKDRQAQAHEGHKAWQSLDLERLTWR